MRTLPDSIIVLLLLSFYYDDAFSLIDPKPVKRWLECRMNFMCFGALVDIARFSVWKLKPRPICMRQQHQFAVTKHLFPAHGKMHLGECYFFSISCMTQSWTWIMKASDSAHSTLVGSMSRCTEKRRTMSVSVAASHFGRVGNGTIDETSKWHSLARIEHVRHRRHCGSK